MPILNPKQILIAPLDWGLGHTARCVPLIRHIRALGHHPIVAGNASQQAFIQQTFGAIDFIHLDGYNITYSKWNRFAQAGLLSQLPRLHKTIRNEHQWLQELSQRIHIDGIISDNRYGLYHASIPSVIMTHQLMVLSGMGSMMDRAIQKVHYKYLEQFGNTWVVDIPGSVNLAGKLSHPHILPTASKYIGLLSRFEEKELQDTTEETLLILLSGPEPQRSILSRILWQQATRYNGKVVFVEGSDTAVPKVIIPPHITYHKRLTDKQLAPILQAANMVVCRSGYSTLMDVIALRKKAILIPTPGQTEQAYLARHIHAQGIYYATKQREFNLDAALKGAAGFPYHLPSFPGAYSMYKSIVSQWLNGL